MPTINNEEIKSCSEQSKSSSPNVGRLSQTIDSTHSSLDFSSQSSNIQSSSKQPCFPFRGLIQSNLKGKSPAVQSYESDDDYD